MRSLFALLAMLGFVLSATFGLLPATRAGVQCPTAVVQQVTVRDCCGRLVTRAPLPSENGFKQCRCEEKRQGSLRSDASPRYEVLLPARLDFEVPSVLPPLWTEHPYLAREAAGFSPPAIHPPASA